MSAAIQAPYRRVRRRTPRLAPQPATDREIEEATGLHPKVKRVFERAAKRLEAGKAVRKRTDVKKGGR